ncbi:uncharacterized protein TOT_020000919 [Theileria orientalis strain Shintoku]|uniref:PPM-type phosphatase domain-containing protein n=1 Tax=Theileria orientalis strain Shintoku TaxID=869250 RepID=J4D8A3_THEOR|nr:uncharacterized protein TOT_020000919 [Theileria orientalis strain Shintoku]PVC49900.1 hypothetical protein MACL_00002674 [Theileria orientalis]BAM40665.1 uncharacterized protein TOT_020000919 [Theileria orientalis strain Shintoku]|eukprot:XP_009690966.1 uncharacterized protein TOT_020000919 [Theileria orientalis strain Shintoku]
MGKTPLDTPRSTDDRDNKTIKGSGKGFRKGRNGPKWNRIKQENGKLTLGTKGLLVTNSMVGKYKDAMQEILSILREHSGLESVHREEPKTKPVEPKDMDPERLLEEEISKVNEEFSRFVPGSCISKGLNFVVFKYKEDVPSKYVQEIFTKILESKAYTARFLSKIVPIDRICNANLNDLKGVLENIFKAEFPLSAIGEGVCVDTAEAIGSESTINTTANDNASKSEDEVGNDGDNSPEESSVPKDTWALYFKRTNSNSLSHESVLDLITRLLGGKYRVNLKFPDKLIVVCVVKSDSLRVPESGQWFPDPESDWYIHESQDWMHNPNENVYFHIESKTIVPFNQGEEAVADGNEDVDDGVDLEDHKGHEEEHEDLEEEEEEEDLAIDFNKDLMAGTSSHKGQHESKVENEDRFITRECLSIQYVSNSEALCYFSGVFDGHQGPACSDYIVKHLKNNILTVFRQTLTSNSFKKRKMMSNNSFKLNQFPSNSGSLLFSHVGSCLDNCLGNHLDSFVGCYTYCLLTPLMSNVDHDPTEDTVNKKVDWEIYNLLYAIKKGVEMLDYNYCSYCVNSQLSNSSPSNSQSGNQHNIDPSNIFNLNGSTLNLLFLMGPDDYGRLKLIAANVGDSRAILCMRDGERYVAKDLTLDHKPNLKKERERIVKGGGSVERIQNTWRALLRVDQRGVLCGLSTSRSIGDYILKGNIISGEVDLFVFDVDFDDYMFVAQCTDGVTDRLSSQEIVDSILESIGDGLSPEKAAEKVVKLAEHKKSFDDKTCNIIYFTWHKEFYSKVLDPDKPEDGENETDQANQVEQSEEQEEDEDIFM